ncbi:hypothetical protein PG984_013937 [Apiospora sp. TS-2023a]
MPRQVALPDSGSPPISPVAPRPKLRDSCHACASSKVKCSKEKPTCARCAKRGRPCQYFVTRRGGRNRKSQSQTQSMSGSPGGPTGNDNTPAPTSPSTAADVDIDMDTDTGHIPATNDSIQVFLGKDGTTTLAETGASSPGQPLEAQQLLPLEDLFASPIDFDMSDFTSMIDFDLSDFTSTNNTGSVSSTHDWASAHPPTTTIDGTVTDSLADVNNTIFSFGDSTATVTSTASHESSFSLPTSSAPLSLSTGDTSTSDGSSCGCHPRALEVLKQFCSPPGGQTRVASSSSLQAVIDENERVLDTVGTMLPCACSQDGFLLATISRIAFKVMARYEVAARCQQHSLSPSCTSPSSCSSSCSSSSSSAPSTTPSAAASGDTTSSDGSGNGHGVGGGEEHHHHHPMAARVVLGELYRVQRFLNGLSRRLQQMASLDAAGGGREPSSYLGLLGGPGVSGDNMINNNMGGVGGLDDLSLPFSPAFYCQLEANLRRRLRGLSTDIAELVRTA